MEPQITQITQIIQPFKKNTTLVVDIFKKIFIPNVQPLVY